MKYKEKKISRLRTGRNQEWFQTFYEGSYVGISYGLEMDLSNDLFDNWRDFNKKYIDKIIKLSPGKSRVGAGLNCGVIWTLSKGLPKDAILLCPDKDGNFMACKIISDYYYSKEEPHHRRKVEWFKTSLSRSEMSQSLINSLNAQNTLIDISKHSDEIEAFLYDNQNKISTSDSSIIEPSEFVLEKHLEDFLVKNWSKTKLGKEYNIYIEDGQMVGQQYQSDTGPIDILAISKNKKTLLVVELKKGRVSDNVVGQIQRYMGFVKDELLEKGQNVKGVIIGFEDDVKLQRALSVTNDIDFYKYKVDFKLYK